ncbi:MAG: glycosyltransferase family 39 protein [Bdellovibrionota bacterium]
MKPVLRAWWIALAIKCVLAALVPLSNDEAYYWVWGHHLQWSYFDHPPFVGWLFYLGSFFDFASPQFQLVRWPAILLGHCTLLVWAKILEPYLDEQKSKLWFYFVLVSPIIGFGSLVVTPDIPLVFFWSLSLLLLLRALETKSLAQYAALGAALGLGFCSKYLIVLFVPITFIWLIASGEWRKVKWSFVPMTVIVGLIFCFPVLYWNYKNEWASFAFQLDHGLQSEKPELTWPIEYVIGQILLLFPPVAYFAFRRTKEKSAQFLLYFGWVPVAFFFYTSFRAHVEANWPIMAYPALLSLAVLNANEKTVRRIAIFWLVAGLIVASEALFRWVPVDAKYLKTREFSRFDSLITEAVKPETYLGSYQMAAAISYRTQTNIYKLAGLNRRDFYDFIPEANPQGDRFRFILDIGNAVPSWLTESNGYEIVSSQQIDESGYRVIEVYRHAQDSDR